MWVGCIGALNEGVSIGVVIAIEMNPACTLGTQQAKSMYGFSARGAVKLTRISRRKPIVAMPELPWYELVVMGDVVKQCGSIRGSAGRWLANNDMSNGLRPERRKEGGSKLSCLRCVIGNHLENIMIGINLQVYDTLKQFLKKTQYLHILLIEGFELGVIENTSEEGRNHGR